MDLPPEGWFKSTPAKLSAEATTAAAAVRTAGATNHRARPTKVPTSKPQPITTVAHPKANAPRLWAWPAINHTAAPTTVAAPMLSNPSADRGGRGRSRRRVAHSFHCSPLEPSAVAVSAAGEAAGWDAGISPRQRATAAPRRPTAMTQPALGSVAPPPNSHRAEIKAAAMPTTRRISDGDAADGESASSRRPAM